MKSLAESLFDKKGTLDRRVYKYHPQTKEELKECIFQELKLQGPNANLNCIDTSMITDMSWLFDNFTNIRNIDISMWDVSNVKSMIGVFYGRKDFNSDLSRWNVSNVRNMDSMFCFLDSFNSDLSKWDVSNVENMRGMFYRCENFNSDISRWDVSCVEDMSYMFYKCKKFNSDLSKWDVSKVENMTDMFEGCKSLKKIPSWYKK